MSSAGKIRKGDNLAEKSSAGKKSRGQKSVGVLIFKRDEETGDLLCRALAERYSPSLLVYERSNIFDAIDHFDILVAVMATGIVVRHICRRLKDKWSDTPVVAVDSSLMSAVPLIGGHHGANDLAIYLAERLGLYPAITTATDASRRPSIEAVAERFGATLVNRESSRNVNLAFLKEDLPVLRMKGPKVLIVDDDVAVLKSIGGVVVGLGAKRGVTSEEVIDAIISALRSIGRTREDIRVIATAWMKRDEAGITEAAKKLGSELIFLTEDVLNGQTTTTPSRARDLGLLGVAEPAALALSNRLLSQKRAYGRVTVALGE